MTQKFTIDDTLMIDDTITIDYTICKSHTVDKTLDKGMHNNTQSKIRTRHLQWCQQFGLQLPNYLCLQ